MNSLKSCYQSDGEIILVFENNINVNSITASNFSLSAASITGVTPLDNKITINFENETNRPLILSCEVEDVNNFNATYSRIVARELNYKMFNDDSELSNYLQGSPNTNLDGKIYYDAVDGKIYYDDLGNQFASNLNNIILVHDGIEYLKSIELINGVSLGWIST